MADNIEELKDTVAQALESNGVLAKIRAELRKHVFLAIDAQEKQDNPSQSKKARQLLQDPQGILALQLFTEFLDYYELDFTQSVLTAEANVEDMAQLQPHNLRAQFPNVNDQSPTILQLLKGSFSPLKENAVVNPKTQVERKEPPPHQELHTRSTQKLPAMDTGTQPPISPPTSPVHDTSFHRDRPTSPKSPDGMRVDEVDGRPAFLKGKQPTSSDARPDAATHPPAHVSRAQDPSETVSAMNTSTSPVSPRSTSPKQLPPLKGPLDSLPPVKKSLPPIQQPAAKEPKPFNIVVDKNSDPDLPSAASQPPANPSTTTPAPSAVNNMPPNIPSIPDDDEYEEDFVQEELSEDISFDDADDLQRMYSVQGAVVTDDFDSYNEDRSVQDSFEDEFDYTEPVKPIA